MLLSNRHRSFSKFGAVGSFIVALSLLFLSAPMAYAQSANRALKMNPKAYTGKRAWWLNYQYFPELTIFGQSDDTIPDVKHRYSFFLNGGYAGFNFRRSDAESEAKFGIGAGFRYSHFVSPNWGFRTGLGFNYSSSSASMGPFRDKFVKIDQEFDIVRYKFNFESVKENYDAYLLDIPVQLLYQWKRFVAGAGLKISMPIVVSYDQLMTGVNTSAYFPQYDTYIDDSWVMGCGNYGNIASDNKFVVAPVICLLSADLEYLIPLKRKYAIGVGAYVDYSISSVIFRKSRLTNNVGDQESMVSTTNEVPIEVVTNSLMSALKNNEADRVVPNIKYLNVGIKVSFNINSYGPPKPKTKPY